MRRRQKRPDAVWNTSVPSKSPTGSQVERLRAAQHEGDHMFRLSVSAGVNPQRTRSAVGIGFHLKPQIVVLIEVEVSRQIAGNAVCVKNVLGGADVENTRELDEIVGHGGAPEMQRPARGGSGVFGGKRGALRGSAGRLGPGAVRLKRAIQDIQCFERWSKAERREVASHPGVLLNLPADIADQAGGFTWHGCRLRWASEAGTGIDTNLVAVSRLPKPFISDEILHGLSVQGLRACVPAMMPWVDMKDTCAAIANSRMVSSVS